LIAPAIETSFAAGFDWYASYTSGYIYFPLHNLIMVIFC
jgi:hypothetical protein